MTIRNRNARRGTVLVLVALLLIGLLGLVALSIDIGLIAVSRTETQTAADIAARSGARMLNGESAVQYNIAQWVTTAKTAATYNRILSQNVQTSEVTVRTGVYKYNAA